MKKLPALLAGLCLSCTLLAGCASPHVPASVPNASQTTYFTDRDSETSYDAASTTSVDLSQLKDAPETSGVSVEGSRVTLTQEGTYLVSGELAEGSLIVDAPNDAKVHLILQEATLSSSTTTPLVVSQADKVFITLEGDSSLAQTSEAASQDLSDTCALLSSSDISFNGTGSLKVTSASGTGIDCKDDLVIASGTYQIDAALHGVEANDSICIKEATMHVTSGKDGLHAENNDDASLGYLYVESGSLDIQSQGDGASASSWMDIHDGSLTVTSGGGASSAAAHSSAQVPEAPEAPPGSPDVQVPGQGYGAAPGIDGQESLGQKDPEGMPVPGGTPPTTPPGDTMPPEGTQEAPPTEPSDAVLPSNDSAAASSGDADDATSAKGLKAGTSLTLRGGTLTIDAAEDALHSNGDLVLSGGKLTLAAGDDGAHAEGALTVSGGTTTISTSYEGLEGAQVDVSGGSIELVASDDGINASDGSGSEGFGPRGAGDSTCTVTISGGTLSIQASGDAIDSNGSLEITGGAIECEGPTQGDSSILDFDTTGTIAGGTFRGTGAAKMVQTLTSTTQGVLTVNTKAQQAGTEVVLKDENGSVIDTWEAGQSFELVIYSSANIKPQATYQIQVGSQTLSTQAS